MASLVVRLLEPTNLTPSQKQARQFAQDLGAYKQLHIQIRVLKAGSGGNLQLEHAAVNEEDAYLPLAGATAPLNAAGGTFVTVTNFLRHVRWATDAGVAGTPNALADIVAKE